MKRAVLAFAALVVCAFLMAQSHTGAMLDLTQTFTGNNTFSGTTTISGTENVTGSLVISGTCTGCGGGSGTVNSGTASYFGYYASTGTTISGNSRLTDLSNLLTYSGTSGIKSTHGFTDSTVSGTDEGVVPTSGGALQYFAMPQGALAYETVANGGPAFYNAASTDLSDGSTIAHVNNQTFTGTTTVATLQGNTTGVMNAFQLTTQNYSALSTCNSSLEGAFAPVHDSTTNTWGATISGGGSDPVLAYCDGTNWTVAAK